MTDKGRNDFDGSITNDGYKHSFDNPEKVPLTLIPPVFLTLVGKVLAYGAKKYARGQWMRGMPFCGSMDGVKRHIQAWENGEDIDPESGLPHLAHAATGLSFIMHFQHGPRAAEYTQLDDRLYKPAEVAPGTCTHGWAPRDGMSASCRLCDYLLKWD